MIANSNQGAVVVPWDYSWLCRAGLDHALQLTGDSMRLHVIHVATPLSGPDCGVLYATAEKQKCQELECRFRDQVADNPKLESVKFHVYYGYAGNEIARFADRYQAELIVVPSRTNRTISDILFGGLAKHVVSHARRPVLVHQVDDSANLQSEQSNISTRIKRFWRKPNLTKTQ